MVADKTLLRNRYRVEETIGETSVSAVYKAKDQRLNVIVFLKENCSGEDALCKQFEREASWLAALNHRSLPKVIDYFTEGGCQFLVLEFIPGKDLSDLLKWRQKHGEGPFDLNQVLGLADQVLDALEYLHGSPEQIVHRDVKPQNLILTPLGEVILLDLGLAESLSASARREEGGVCGGTPPYAPPEQIRDELADPRNDLYALGATLYHLLTGAMPPEAIKREAAAAKGCDLLRPANELNPLVPREVAAVLNKALALNPHERPATAAEMRLMLREVKQQTICSLPPRQEPKRIIWRRLAFATSIVLLLVTVGLTLWQWQGSSAARADDPGLPRLALPAPETAPTNVSAPPRIKLLSVFSSPFEIYKVALSPNGKFVVLVGEESEVQLRQASDGRLVQELKGHLQSSRAVAISPDGKVIASGSDDGTIRLWQANNGQLLNTLPGHAKWVFNLSFSHDGKRLVSAGGDKTVRLWRVNDGALMKTIEAPEPEDLIAAISADQRIIGFYNPDHKQFRLWSSNENKLLRELNDHPSEVTGGGAFSPDGKQLALGSSQGVVRFWSVADGTLLSVFQGPDAETRCVAFSPDGQMMAAGWSDRSIWLWHVRDGRLLKKLEGHRKQVSSIAFSANGRELASGSQDGTIRLWQITR